MWALPAPLDTLVGQPQRCPAPTLRGLHWPVTHLEAGHALPCNLHHSCCQSGVILSVCPQGGQGAGPSCSPGEGEGSAWLWGSRQVLPDL